MDINFNAKSVETSAVNNRTINVNAYDIEMSEILDHFHIKDILNHFGVNSLLDEIGEDEAKSHFDLINNPE